MSEKTRFHLYVKAGNDGKCFGDCPFSQRVCMFANLKIAAEEFQVIPVDITNKPESFLQLNPEGKVPVLVDLQNENKIIPDSGKIVEYLENIFPQPAVIMSNQIAEDASSGIFPKFAAMMKNKDAAADTSLKDALIAELKKLDDYLAQKSSPGAFLVDNNICELDCQVLPKLRHVQVAGKKYKQFDIPAELSALHQYIQLGEASDVYRKTCPADDQIIWGWSKVFS